MKLTYLCDRALSRMLQSMQGRPDQNQNSFYCFSPFLFTFHNSLFSEVRGCFHQRGEARSERVGGVQNQVLTDVLTLFLFRRLFVELNCYQMDSELWVKQSCEPGPVPTEVPMDG